MQFQLEVTPKVFAIFSPGFERAAKTLGYLFQSKSFLDTVSTGSDSDLVNDTSQNHYEYCILITDQVATAPCTDCVQAQRPT